MNLKREIIALAVRLAADHSTLVRKPDAFGDFISVFLTGETYDQRIARELEADLDRVADAVRNVHTRRQFRRITKNI